MRGSCRRIVGPGTRIIAVFRWCREWQLVRAADFADGEVVEVNTPCSAVWPSNLSPPPVPAPLVGGGADGQDEGTPPSKRAGFLRWCRSAWLRCRALRCGERDRQFATVPVLRR